jgi:hypothetical protein
VRHLLIAAMILLALASFVWIARLGMKAGRGKGRAAGLSFALGMAFSGLFDPAKRAAMEHVDRHREAAEDPAEAAGGK